MVNFRLKDVIHIWKAYASAANLSYLETNLVLPTRRQNFAGKLDSTFYNIWDLVITGELGKNFVIKSQKMEFPVGKK